ncbi:hypothetical protein ABF162_25360 (plasmid) [Vibrio coralliilyticus]|uniref:hypothetical protein n=1 Tax=Vibrio coralliilyticus TaxID=190893 RepID=UPI001185A3F0|nr:hypothetical protein [Vibrio coralliilyticus]
MKVLVVILFALTVTCWFLGYQGHFMPEYTVRPSWFQRSGTASLVFVVIADAILASNSSTYFPGKSTVVVGGVSKSQKVAFSVLSCVAVILTIMCSLISGYGDIFWKSL